MELKNYIGLEVKLEQKAPSVTVDEVNNRKARLAEQFVEYKESEGPLQNGHISTIDFVGRVDGVEFEGGSAKDFELEIGSGMFIPGFEEQMVGMAKGETRVVKVTFPEAYTPSLAGKDAEFTVTLHSMKEKVSAGINEKTIEEFAKKQGIEGLKTEADLDKFLMNQIYYEKQRAVQDETLRKLDIAISECADVEPTMESVEKDVEYFLANYEMQAKSMGMELETFASLVGLGGVEGLKAQIRGEAIVRDKVCKILEAIAIEKGFEATEEEIDARIKQVAERYGKDPEELKKEVSAEQVRLSVVTDKAYNLVYENAKIIFAE
ncbi:MAG: trigger factor [Clostridia bacterium]|nr:trigger factor [Clostridia bacterium]